MKEFNKERELTKLKLKNNKSKYIKYTSIIVSVVILLVGIIYFTFAKFESNKSYTLIEGKIGDYTSGDLTIGAVIDGVSSSFPNKGDAFLTNVECKDSKNNSINVEYNKSTWTLTNLTVEDKTKCTFYFTTDRIPSSEFKIGDFVYMTPTLTSYTPTTDSTSPYYTGTSTPGTINPSELTKWVIIKDIENDGVVEMVSYNVSSDAITFYGRTGYNNYVGALNEIARSYTNELFIDTSKIRHMGYLPGSSVEQCDLCGADTFYETDVNLIKNAFKIRKEETLKSSDINGETKSYLLASRNYNGEANWGYLYYGRKVDIDGMVTNFGALYRRSNTTNFVANSQIRPILTLKDDVYASPNGDGSEDNPWVLIE